MKFIKNVIIIMIIKLYKKKCIQTKSIKLYIHKISLIKTYNEYKKILYL